MDGSKCIGEFKDGKHNGFSIYHSVNGKIDEQYWEKGQYISKDFKGELWVITHRNTPYNIYIKNYSK